MGGAAVDDMDICPMRGICAGTAVNKAEDCANTTMAAAEAVGTAVVDAEGCASAAVQDVDV